jgi:glucokinase
LDNKLWRGIDDTAAEIGHMTIDPDGPLCGCGNQGCLEALSSATALVRRAIERISKGEKSILDKMPKYSLTAKDIYRVARSGDRLACELLDETGRYLGIAIASLVNLLNPEKVILCGRMAKAGRFILNPLREEVKKRSFYIPGKRVKICTSLLGEYAGLIGAAGIVFKPKP